MDISEICRPKPPSYLPSPSPPSRFLNPCQSFLAQLYGGRSHLLTKEMSEKEQKDGSAALGLQRTETKESLEDLGISDKSPPLDVNYPEVGRAENPEFPEEYTIETKTGLVPESALKQVRSEASQHKASRQDSKESGKR